MIRTEELNSISQWLTQNFSVGSVEADLRSEYPDLHFTFCMDDDVTTHQPVLEQEMFNLYLIDSRNHCLNFTQDMEVATGIVVAEVEPD